VAARPADEGDARRHWSSVRQKNTERRCMSSE
jgi:hypothetical protein